MIVAPGWSALAFKAAMSASSASTTIRSAFPFTLSPTVNCHDIFGLPQGYVTNERLPASTDTLRASSISLCGVCSRRADLSAHPYMHKNREWGGRGLKGHHMLMVRPTRASCIGISQQWRASLRDGNSVTPAQVISIKIKDEFIKRTDVVSIEVSVEIAPSPPSPASRVKLVGCKNSGQVALVRPPMARVLRYHR